MIAALRDGVSAAEHPRGVLIPELQPADLEPLAAASCTHQVPRVGGYQSHNRVLYLGRNLASDELAQRLGLDASTAGLVLRLTRNYTEHALNAMVGVLETNRAVSIVGEAGSGKSTLAAALRRAPEDSSVPIGLVQAAAFVSAVSDVSELARSLAGQLAELPGFEQARRRFELVNQDRWDTLDIWQRQLIGPLSLLHQPVRLLIDGIDQLDGTVDEIPLRHALAHLVDETARTSLVLTSRHDPGLPGSTVIRMPMLEEQTARRFLQSRGIDSTVHDRLIQIAAGRWLVLDLAAEQASDGVGASLEGLYADLVGRARARRGAVLDDVLELLAAAGTGPVLPVDVLQTALRRRADITRANVFEVIGDEDLYRVIDRTNPGTAWDRAGLFHQTFTDHIARNADLTRAHHAIADALDELAADHDSDHFRDEPASSYAFDAQASHWWEAGRPDRVVVSLLERTHAIPRVNLARWQQWSKRLEDVLGADEPETLIARANIAGWTGDAGDARSALTLFQALLPDQVRVLGPDHSETLATRNSIALWTAETGDARGALVLSRELLSDQERVLGTDNPETFKTRSIVAQCTGESGDARAALALFQAILCDQARVLVRDHAATLTTRGNIAGWTERAGDPGRALALYQALLPAVERIRGSDHPETLTTRNNIAHCTAESGDVPGALAVFQGLLVDRERVLGANHLGTLATRANIARWTGETGEVRRALVLSEALLPDLERVLGLDHRLTVTVKARIEELRTLGNEE